MCRSIRFDEGVQDFDLPGSSASIVSVVCENKSAR